eukprot:CAMPEP_0167778608 /NCGR_PEP_ID=MMETSP0111_2-20121227/4348_1 /TAXON_ID=91324 /ORGANISM="Lotharella globosa, Strain CCCM811" /LENGTH=109 /DNA_ID=CAMNT_0007668931 /DNA_START=21 /DNA_END=350 /DNA_ORIENTATION=+
MPIQWYGIENKPPYKSEFDFVPKNQKYKHAGLGMDKVWSGVPRINGEVTHTISPYRLKVVSPMLKKGPGNILKTIRYNTAFVLPGLVIGSATYMYGNWKFAQDALHHRD